MSDVIGRRDNGVWMRLVRWNIYSSQWVEIWNHPKYYEIRGNINRMGSLTYDEAYLNSNIEACKNSKIYLEGKEEYSKDKRLPLTKLVFLIRRREKTKRREVFRIMPELEWNFVLWWERMMERKMRMIILHGNSPIVQMIPPIPMIITNLAISSNVKGWKGKVSKNET